MPTFKSKFRRYAPGAVVAPPMDVDPSAPTRQGVIGSDVVVEGSRKKSAWFDWFPRVTIVAGMLNRWVEVYRQSNFLLPTQRGLMFVFCPWIQQPGNWPEGGPLIVGPAWIAGGGSATWRICSRGMPVPGWEQIDTVNFIWGFVSPVPLLEFWQEDTLSIEIKLVDPPALFVGGIMGARMAGRIVPR